MACSSIVLPGAGRGHDERALALPERGHEVHDAGGQDVGQRLQPDAVLRVERGQVVEEDLLLRAVRRLEVDRVHLDEGEVALVLLGRADLAADGVAGAQVELADLRGRDVDVVRPGQVAVLGGAQEAEAVGQDLQHALGEDQALPSPPARAGSGRPAPASSWWPRRGSPATRATWASLVMPISLSAARSSRLSDGGAGAAGGGVTAAGASAGAGSARRARRAWAVPSATTGTGGAGSGSGSASAEPGGAGASDGSSSSATAGGSPLGGRPRRGGLGRGLFVGHGCSRLR